MSKDTHRLIATSRLAGSWPATYAGTGPVWTSEAADGELSIAEHAAAIALVEDLRPYCLRWSVELERPDIAPEIGLIIAGKSATAAWAIYRDTDRSLHFEDLVGGMSYTFGTMAAGLRFVRAVLEAAAAIAQENGTDGNWWDRLPAWLLDDTPRR